MKLAELNDATTPEQLTKLIAVQTGLFSGAAELLAEIILRLRRLEAAQQDARLKPTQDPARGCEHLGA